MKRCFDILRAHEALTDHFLITATAVFVLVFGGLSAYSTLRSPAAYVATGRIKLQPTVLAGKGPSRPQILSRRLDPLFVRTECEMLKSDAVLGAVLRDLDLIRDGGSGNWRPDKGLQEADRLLHLRSQLQVRPATESGEIEVLATNTDRGEAARLMEALVRAYQAERVPELQQDPIPADERFSESQIGIVASVQVEPVNKLLRPGEQALGAFLLSLGVATALSWRLLMRRHLPAPTGILAPVFLVVFLLVAGGGTLHGAMSFGAGAAVGLWLGLVFGTLAHWTVFMRRTYREAPNTFLTVFWGAFVLVLGYGALTEALRPYWYSSTAVLELRRVAVPEAGSATTFGEASLDRQSLWAECGRVCSKAILAQVLDRASFSRDPMRGFEPLSHRGMVMVAPGNCFRVTPIRGTTLIALQALTTRSADAQIIVNLLAEIYRDWRANAQIGDLKTNRLAVKIVSRGSPPRAPVSRGASLLAAHIVSGVTYASAAAGGAMFGAWLTTRKARRARLHIKLFLLPVFVLSIILIAVAPPGVKSAFGTVVVTLLVFFGGTGVAYLRIRNRLRFRAGTRHRHILPQVNP